MDATYHIRIKQDYAAAVINELQQKDAIEFIIDDIIPEWQKNETLKRMDFYNKNPGLLIDMGMNLSASLMKHCNHK